ncbi:MAG: type II toxin-antitoxin system RelE/ParE family toxin [Bacteroidetes bacterium]|nr:type II toxin-antitoxin system RelE/ParE family toxin [Bacteroidota bacterium]MCW5895808.1 type II toxin-antitoxin system RelE/ParE family toxin [Bacteroidota bacterium]
MDEASRIRFKCRAGNAGSGFFYEERQVKLGVAFLKEIERAVRRLIRFPESGVIVSQRIRRSMVKKFPYAVLYSNQPEKIVIVAVMHCRRKPGYWKKRLR